MRGRGSKIILAVLLCMVMLANSNGVVMAAKNVSAADTQKKPLTGGALSVTVNECLGGNTKEGKTTGIEIAITNNGEDFSGKVQVIQNGYDVKNVEEVEVLIAGGESKTVILPVGAANRSTEITLVVTDEEDKVILEKGITLSLTISTNALIGVFSEDATNLSYFSNAFATMVPMSETTFPAETGALDTYDVIIINNYDTSKLSSQQYETLKTWVRKGGTLVIGTGENSTKTLAAFQDDFIAGTYKTTKLVATSLGLSADEIKTISQFQYTDIGEPGDFHTSASAVRNIKILTEEEIVTKQAQATEEETGTVPIIEKECLDLMVTGADLCLQEGSQPLLQRKEEGKGVIEVFGIDLGLDNTVWSTLGNQLQKIVYSCMATERKLDMLRILDGYFGVGGIGALSDGDISNIPKTSKFFLLIVIYLIIVGPVLYLLLKKYGKRDYLWGAIPIVAVLFTILITSVGGGNKYRKASVSYVEYVYLSESNTVVDTVQLSITTPKSKDYNFELSNGYVGEQTDSWVYDYVWGGDNSYATTTIGNSSGEKEQIYIDSATAFGNYTFGALRIKTQDTPYESTVDYDNSNNLTGMFTNHSGFNLSNCAILSSDKIYVLGKVDEGESVDASTAVKSYHYGDIYWNDGMEQLIGSTYDMAGRMERLKYDAIISLYNSYLGSVANTAEFFIGFVEEGAEDTFTDGIDVDASGITLVIIPLNTVQNKEKESISSDNINEMLTAATSSITSQSFEEYTADQQELVCQYQLAEAISNVSLSIDFYSKNGYDVANTVYAYNFDTKAYMKVLDYNTISCDLGKEYISEDHQMVLKYLSPLANNYDTYALPLVMMEGGQN